MCNIKQNAESLRTKLEFLHSEHTYITVTRIMMIKQYQFLSHHSFFPTTLLSSVTILEILLIYELHINGIIELVLFYIWLFLLSIDFEIDPCFISSLFFFIALCSILLHDYVTIYSFSHWYISLIICLG